MAYTQNKQIREKVRKFISEHAYLRDDDLRLIANIWARDYKFYTQDALHPEVKKFLKAFSQGHLSHPESIRRQRQVLQMNEEELRGEHYRERNKVIEATEREGYHKIKTEQGELLGVLEARE